MHLYEYIFKCVQLSTRLAVLIASMNCMSNKYFIYCTSQKNYHTAKQEVWVQERERCRCPVSCGLSLREGVRGVRVGGVRTPSARAQTRPARGQ